MALLLPIVVLSQQTSKINYQIDDSAVLNPERGFYKHTETSSNQYIPLDINDLIAYRTKNNVSLILRIFYLEKFINKPIDKKYLNAIEADFKEIRNSGLKCIVRFAYTKEINGQREANKAQIIQHITQLKPILETNSDIIALVQAGFIGTWGEWFYTSNFGMKPTETDFANRKLVLETLLKSIPQNRMVQIRTPNFKQKMYQTKALTKDEAYSTANIARIGHYNDCFLSDETDNGTFNNTNTEFPYLEKDTKYVVMGGETCDPNTIRSNCDNALAEMNRFHWSFLNSDYNAAVLSKFKTNHCLDEIGNRLGYRFVLQSAEFPNQLSVNEKLHFRIQLLNTGFATPFNKKLVYLILRNKEDKTEFSIELKTDPRFWDKEQLQELDINTDLPKNIPSGQYQLLLHIADESISLRKRPDYAIRLANIATWEPRTGYNKLLHTIAIEGSKTISTAIENTIIEPIIKPNPADESFLIEATNLENYQLDFYNSLGEKIEIEQLSEAKNKKLFNSEHLQDGTYLVEIKRNSDSQFLKLIIKH